VSVLLLLLLLPLCNLHQQSPDEVQHQNATFGRGSLELSERARVGRSVRADNRSFSSPHVFEGFFFLSFFLFLFTITTRSNKLGQGKKKELTKNIACCRCGYRHTQGNAAVVAICN
jgi:hypothetical protein